jgi:hypothetical protein
MVRAADGDTLHHRRTGVPPKQEMQAIRISTARKGREGKNNPAQM